jgi:hypothetical protein
MKDHNFTYLRSRHQWWKSSILCSKVHKRDWSSSQRWSNRWRDVRHRIPNRNFRSRNHGNRSRRVKNRKLPNYDVSLRLVNMNDHNFTYRSKSSRWRDWSTSTMQQRRRRQSS